MTPLDLYWQYRDLTVELPDDTQVYGVDVCHYRPASGDPAADLETDAGLPLAYAAFRSALRRYGERVRTGGYRVTIPPRPGKRPSPPESVELSAVWSCFRGRGAPAAVRQALRLAAGFGLAKPTMSGMTEYAAKHFGLDAPGFVGVYFALNGRPLGPDTPPPQFAPPHRRRTAADAVAEGDVILWEATGHLALVDRADAQRGRLACWIAESVSPSLNYSQATIEAKAGGFGLRRGDGPAEDVVVLAGW